MEGRNYETELPEGYRAVKVVDAMDIKLAIILNVVALLVMLGIGIALIAIRKSLTFELDIDRFMSSMLPCGLAIFAVLAVHELLHGLAYWVMTKHRLSFGISVSCAYCGVPDIYVYRSTALIALLTPFTVFTILFLAGLFFTPVASAVWDISAVLLAIHTGGCVGDLYDTWLYAVHFKDKSTLMRDTGPAQTFYVKAE